MSTEEINELRAKVCLGLRMAEENMLREKALHNDTIISYSGGRIREYSAKYLLRKFRKD